RYINGFPDQPPARTGISLGDTLGGMFAAQGILSALYWRDTRGEGRGQVVDVSLVESCFSMLESIAPEYDRLGLVREASGTNLRGIAPSNLFRSRDDKWVVIAANQDTLFRRLCSAMGQPDLADDPRFATHAERGKNQQEIEGLVAEWASHRDASELDQLLREAGVVCGPVHTIAEVFEDPHFRARGMLETHYDPEIGPFLGPGVVPSLSETPGSVRWTGPWEPGAHNQEIFQGLLGLKEEELERLSERGVI
ncbi:MAG: CaiB/BaiF CoA transferase family protein, partial [Acidimicrobiia bacterium]